MHHIPVMLNDVLGAIGALDGAHVLDATFGAGGYTRAFLSRGAHVVAFDRDPTVMPAADAVGAQYGDCFTFIPKTFDNMAELPQTFDAIVFDLGISSMQIDTAERGFSFRTDAPLDMRMSCDGMSAAQLIEDFAARDDVHGLAAILRDFGDIKNAAALARKIMAARPQTTFALRDLVGRPRDVAPVFQALRMAVNDEMGALRRALAAVPDLLKPGGRCICVTFHSIEDRIVKNTFREWTTPPGDPRMPVVAAAPFESIRARTPSVGEISANPRARSAHMRGVIKSY